MLMNGIGVFVMALLAVIVGGFINAKLHPMPDLKMGKDGVITADRAGPASRARARKARPKTAVYYAIDPPLVVNFEDGSVVRFLQITMEVMARDQKAIDSVQKNMPLIRNNLLLLMSNRNYQIADVARGQGEAARGGARRDSRGTEETGRRKTSKICCSPASWCSNGRRGRSARGARIERHLRGRGVRATGEERRGHRAALSISLRSASIARSCRCCRSSPRASRSAPPASLSGLLGRDARMQFTSIESARAADLQAALPMPASVAVVRLKPLAGFAFVCVEPGLLLALLDGFFGGSGRARDRRPGGHCAGGAAVPGADAAQLQRRFDRRVDAGIAARAGAREAGDQSAAAAARRPAGFADRRAIHRGVRRMRRSIDWLLPDEHARADSRGPRLRRRQARPRASRRPGRRRSAPRCKRRKWKSARFWRKPQISLRELVRLAPGDIIPIEPPQHVTLLVGEVPLYRGRFGVSQGRNALKILPGGSA